MRLLPVLCGWVLSCAAQYAAVAASIATVPDKPITTTISLYDRNIDVIKVVSTSLSTRTLPTGVKYRSATETCITYTSLITRTITRTWADDSSTTATIVAVQPPDTMISVATTSMSGISTGDAGNPVTNTGTDHGASSGGSSILDHSTDSNPGQATSGINQPTSDKSPNPVTLTTMKTTVDAHGSSQVIPVVITAAPAGQGDNTHNSPSLATTTEAAPSGIFTTAKDEEGNIIQVTLPAGSVPTTTDAQGHVGTGLVVGQNFTTTTDAQGHVIGVIPGGMVVTDPDAHSTPTITSRTSNGVVTSTTTTQGNQVTQTNPGDTVANPTTTHFIPSGGLGSSTVDISSTMSSFSSEFRHLLPVFTSWEINPQPPHQTQIITGIEKIEDDIKNFASKFNKDITPKCPSKRKRGLLDSVFNVVGDTIEAIIDSLNCITDNLKKLEDNIKKKDVEKVKVAIKELIHDDNPKDDTTTTTKTTTTGSSTSSSSSSCTSDQTAYRVTIRCEPTSSVVGMSTITTTTCSPSTTITTTGCTVTDTTTTVTETATPTPEICERGSCPGDVCEGGTPAWVTVEPMNCNNIPTETAKPPPKRYILGERDDNDPSDTPTIITATSTESPRPLPSIAEGDINKYLSFMANSLQSKRLWLDHASGDTTGKWYPFEQTRTAAGVKGLWGCTSVVIVSRKGVYLSHIYEGPIFVQRDPKTKKIRLSPQDFFEKWTIDALMNGNSESEQLDPLKDLIGTDAEPGPLHYTLSPEIFIMSPFAKGTSGALRYTERIDWLADQLHSRLYPQPQANAYGQEPVLIGYQATTMEIAHNPYHPAGKVITEATLLDHWEQEGDKMIASGRWRMWVGGIEKGNMEFLVRSGASSGPDTAMGDANAQVKRRDKGSNALVCPTPTVVASHSSKSTTHSTTSKSTKTKSSTTLTTTTKTGSAPTAVNPPGQPPGFPPPTANTDAPTHNPSMIKTSGCIDDHVIKPRETANSQFAHRLAKMCSDKVSVDATNGRNDEGSTYSWHVEKDDRGYNYVADIWWDDPKQCGKTQNLLNPMNGWDCEKIMLDNFNRKCPPGAQTDDSSPGRGAFIKIGCVYYRSYFSWRTGEFLPNRPDENTDSDD